MTVSNMEESDSNHRSDQSQEEIGVDNEEMVLSAPLAEDTPSTAAIDITSPNEMESFLVPPKGIIESNLLSSLVEIQVRTEVEACMNSLLIDVEMAHYLRQELKVKACQERVEYLEMQQEATVMETKALQLQREENRLEVADQLVKDLWSLSRELESLTHWKQTHEEKVQSYDEIVAKLAQAEEELAVANRISYGGGVPQRVSDTVGNEEADTHVESDGISGNVEEAKSSLPNVDDVSSAEKEVVAVSSTEAEAAEDEKPKAECETKPEPIVDEVKNEDTKSATRMGENAGDGAASAVPPSSAASASEELAEGRGEAMQGTVASIKEDGGANQTNQKDIPAEGEAAAPAAVTLDDEEPEEEVPGLVEIDIEILMNIFGFLDPIDILNTAQVNLVMYSRVDNLFGLAEDGHGPPRPPERSPAAAPTMARAPAQTSSTAPNAAPPSAPSKKVPPVETKTAPTAAEAAATGALGLFSMLQPRATVPAPASAAATASKQRQQDSPSKGGSQPLNAAVAQSMAAKLSAAELAAIISMTEKLSKMEQEINTLRNEKDELQGKLEGTEAVKQFLIGKVRDVEKNLRTFKENEVKVTQQISSDQEVIGFLDARVQVLERESTALAKEKTQAETDLRNLKGSTGQKITVLSDMLKYEKEKLRENESEWKSTKKVLVKEVKSCRAQILALQAERDGYREQNDMLKRAIVNKGSNGGSSPTRR